MIDYQIRGIVPAKHHIVFRRSDGPGVYYEECFTRRGFDGAYTILYHANPTTDDAGVRLSSRGWPTPVEAPSDGTVRRRLFDTNAVPAGGDMLDRLPVLFNKDITVLFARPTRSDTDYFSNGDGDDLVFVRSGSGRVESSMGWLRFQPGDYVWIPRGVIHRWHWDAGADNQAMVFECHSELRLLNQFRNDAGQLRMDAPFCHRDFVRPEGFAWAPSDGRGEPATLVYKRQGRFSERTIPHHPLDVVGWDGAVYPVAFNIRKFQPRIGQVHLPPTVHGTFAGEGYLVCSFVPRIVDFHPEAVPCPYPHTAPDADEIILYLDGNFTSRKGVGPGSLSLHPAGVPHGPHPGAYERSIGTNRTEELAVMLDTFAPLRMTANAAALEQTAYHDSWKIG